MLKLVFQIMNDYFLGSIIMLIVQKKENKGAHMLEMFEARIE
jgi:hypothetical protein